MEKERDQVEGIKAVMELGLIWDARTELSRLRGI